MPHRFRCLACGRTRESERKFRKFCDYYCRNEYVARKKAIKSGTTLSQRKVEMAMGVYHNEQLTQLLSALNGVRNMPMAEKQAIVLGAIRQYKETRRELVRRVKTASPSEIREVNKWIAKVPGHKPPAGAKYWCTECGANPVAGPFTKCQRCIERGYTSQDLQDAIEPFERKKEADKV